MVKDDRLSTLLGEDDEILQNSEEAFKSEDALIKKKMELLAKGVEVLKGIMEKDPVEFVDWIDVSKQHVLVTCKPRGVDFRFR